MTLEPDHVVTEPGLRRLLTKGFHLVIVCYGDAHLRHQHWQGDWGVRVASPDGSLERTLVLSRPPNAERRFKTLGALVRLLHKYGFGVANVPLRRGARTVNVPMAPWSED